MSPHPPSKEKTLQRKVKASSSLAAPPILSSSSSIDISTPVPSSPKKKIKLSHQPQRSPPHEIIPNIKLGKLDQTAPASKINLKSTSSRQRPIRCQTTQKFRQSARRSYLSPLSFLIKVAIFYLILAYTYFCPKDPTRNPAVCRNLAELHWALEPHISPQFNSFNEKIRIPLQRRINRKLRPINENFVQPSWSYISPHLSKLSHSLSDALEKSGLPNYVRGIYPRHILPALSHLETHYRHKVEPHISSVLRLSQTYFKIIRQSRFIKSARFYLIQSTIFLNRHVVIPVRTQIWPQLADQYNRNVHPRLCRTIRKIYYGLFVDENLVRLQLWKLKKWYKIKLLEKVKTLNRVYVTPQIKKISFKLKEYRNRETKNYGSEPGHSHSESRREQETQATKNKGADSVIAETESVNTGPSVGSSHADTNHSPKLRRISDETDSAKGIEEVMSQDTKPEKLMDQQTTHADLKSGRTWVSTDAVDGASDGDGDGTRAATNEAFNQEAATSIASDGQAFGHEDHENGNNSEEREGAQSDAGSADATLIDDLDDLIEEDKTGRDSTQERVYTQGRRTPEETVEDRKELERIRDDGMFKMAELEKEQLHKFIVNLNAKRDRANIQQHEEFLAKGRLDKVRSESGKLLEKLNKWFHKNELIESKSSQEKLADAELVVKKSLEKLKTKLIDVQLSEIDQYGRDQYIKEDLLMKECWFVVDNYSTNIQAVLGPGLTWLDGVTYRDWEGYHQFRKDSERVKEKMEKIIAGEELEDVPSINRPRFFAELDELKESISSVLKSFEKSLASMQSEHVQRLLIQKDRLEKAAEEDLTRRRKAGEESRRVEDLAGMSEEEIRAVAGDAIASLMGDKDQQKTAPSSQATTSPSPKAPQGAGEGSQSESMADLAKSIMLKKHEENLASRKGPHEEELESMVRSNGKVEKDEL